MNNRNSASATAVQNGPATLADFETAVGKPLGVTHNYINWSQPAPISVLSAESAQRTVPILDWHCGDTDANVAAGSDDRLITSMAESLKSFGRPVFLRWFWEMNFTSGSQVKGCLASGGPQAYVAAWQHIWTIFQQVGATNVAFVWCPGGNGITTTVVPYYPGNQYVDWIAVDDYALSSDNTFSGLFAPFYDKWAATGKPMMIAETGATPNAQATYLEQAAQALPAQFPQIKALVYFDGTGPRGNWSLDTDGLAAFKSLLSSSYFSRAS